MSYTLGAGGMSVFLSLVVGFTGILEAFYYVPTPEKAAASVQTISYLVPFGGLVRSLHYWSAQLLVTMVAVHMLRVFLTGAYASRRRFNHLLGMSLLVGAILLNFTGYVLRWDQGIQWALVVGTNLLKTIPAIGTWLYVAVTGSTELGPLTVLRFYIWHVFGFVLPIVVIFVWHLFRVRRDGGIAVPPPALRTQHERISRSVLVRREVLAAFLTGALLLTLSLIWPAPIAAPITDVQAATGDARAPWFFLWVQQLLRWGDPFILGVLVPLAILAILGVGPYIVRGTEPADLGRWFPPSGRSLQAVAILLALGVVALTILALLPVP